MLLEGRHALERLGANGALAATVVVVDGAEGSSSSSGVSRERHPVG